MLLECALAVRARKLLHRRGVVFLLELRQLGPVDVRHLGGRIPVLLFGKLGVGGLLVDVVRVRQERYAADVVEVLVDPSGDLQPLAVLDVDGAAWVVLRPVLPVGQV